MLGYVTCWQLGLLRIVQAVCAGECSISLACELGGSVCNKHTVHSDFQFLFIPIWVVPLIAYFPRKHLWFSNA